MDANVYRRLENLAQEWEETKVRAFHDAADELRDVMRSLAAESTAEPTLRIDARPEDRDITQLIHDNIPALAAEPTSLHPATEKLVADFSAALREKLAAAERKYGYSDGWLSPDWMDECRAKLREHIEKGDPRDVAAYCAFLWHHGESTRESAAVIHERKHATKPSEPTSGTFEEWFDVWRAGGRPILNQNLAQFGQEAWNAALRTKSDAGSDGAVAWMHTVTNDGGETTDHALSFAPDNFPLMGEAELGLYTSLGHVPLFPHPAGPPVAWMNDSGHVMSDKQKRGMIRDGAHGGEFASAARTAERYATPLYTRPESSAKPAGDDWRPIESAPKDGGSVLLFVGSDILDVPGAASGSYYGTADDGTVTWRLDYDCAQHVINPTHWMPLPAAPK